MPRVLACNPAAIKFYDDGSLKITSPSTESALQAASHSLLVSRQPVVFPTETVYGLGAPVVIPSAISLIYTTKGRPSDNPLIVHVSSIAMLRTLVLPNYKWSKKYDLLMKAFWPGPLTLLFPANTDIIPSSVRAGKSTVAIRMPAHPVARALIAISNSALAAPSANSSGKPSPTKVEHVIRDLGDKVEIILDGGMCDVGVESTVIDGLDVDGKIRVLRPGGVTVEDIERVVGGGEVLVHKRDYQDIGIEDSPTTPGMKYRHYSPSIPVILLIKSPSPSSGVQESLHDVLESSILALSRPKPGSSIKIGLLTLRDSVLTTFLTAPSSSIVIPPIVWHMYYLGLSTDPKTSAQRLFDGLLRLEEQGVEMIMMEGIDETKEGMAVMNRARKAAGEGGIKWVRVGT